MKIITPQENDYFPDCSVIDRNEYENIVNGINNYLKDNKTDQRWFLRKCSDNVAECVAATFRQAGWIVVLNCQEEYKEIGLFKKEHYWRELFK